MKGLLIVGVAYVISIVLAILAFRSTEGQHPLVMLAVAHFGATLVFYIFSTLSDNSNVNDSFWSAAPIAFVFFYLWQTGIDENFIRKGLLLILVSAWGIRLTSYTLYHWRGIGQEDWRFNILRNKTGDAYWGVSFAGFHILPAILSFFAVLPFYPIIFSENPFGFLDLIAVCIIAAGIIIEAISDEQLRRFRNVKNRKTEVLATGFWAFSRHPNYLGETIFWWGIWMLGIAANPEWWWTIIGPVGVTSLFLFITIELMEIRLSGKKGYKGYAYRVPRFIPFIKSKKPSRRISLPG